MRRAAEDRGAIPVMHRPVTKTATPSGVAVVVTETPGLPGVFPRLVGSKHVAVERLGKVVLEQLINHKRRLNHIGLKLPVE